MKVAELDPEILHRLSDRYPKLIHRLDEQKPEIKRDGTAYTCFSGTDPMQGIHGSGMNEEEALEDWEKAWQTKNKET